MKASTALPMTGWLVAGALGAILLTGGFQANQPKFGVVDFNKALQDSTEGKANLTAFEVARDARVAVLTFMSNQRVMTTEQAQSLRALSLRERLTDAERRQLDDLKATVTANTRRFNELSQKAAPTEEERSQLSDFNGRIQATTRLTAQWEQEFDTELGQLRQQITTNTIDRGRAALQELGRREGFSLIFDSNVAPYGANDVTGSLTTAINARR